MNAQKLILTSAAVFFAAVNLARAQSAHYPAGVEGIKGGTLPPPGFYLRDYNYFYFANEFPGGPPDFDLFAYVQAPRPVYISPVQVLGGYLGADALIPLVYQDVKIGSFSESSFGLGDIFFEGTLSWHGDRYDLGVGYGAWAPTGEFDAMHPSKAGKGYWGHMLTAGGTVFLDPERQWSVSLLNRYEINMENSDLKTTPGDVWTLEYGVARALNQTLDVGVIGYYVLQTTKDRGDGAANPTRDQVFGVGPEVSMFWPKLTLFGSLRYIYEVEARNRPEGHTVNLTLTKIF